LRRPKSQLDSTILLAGDLANNHFNEGGDWCRLWKEIPTNDEADYEGDAC
jgi:hypothetical protein